ncbi:hypothetical protein FRC10_002293 [Ceratobasidium sp. 414]|nr:hypothetical protein FRC10_002293 [Ceratobasidium sp. 414]
MDEGAFEEDDSEENSELGSEDQSGDESEVESELSENGRMRASRYIDYEAQEASLIHTMSEIRSETKLALGIPLMEWETGGQGEYKD